MHAAAFAVAGLDWAYIPLLVASEPKMRIQEAVYGLRALGFQGANVTVPHKQTVIPFLDRFNTVVEAIGAVNTISVEADGTLTGDNTDAPGFIRDLQEHHVELEGQNALVLGAGGSARAVVYGLAEAGCYSITILNRTRSKADALVKTIEAFFPSCPVATGVLPREIRSYAEKADLIVNTTSLGMIPHRESTPWDESVALRPDQVVYDLVYNPRQTRFLRFAQEAGAKTISGLGMLIWQGALSFEIWTAQPAPTGAMAEAVEKAMSDHG